MISKIKMIFRFLFFPVILIMLSHCATAQKESAPSPADLKTEKLHDEVRRLEEIAKNHPDQSMRAKAHLQLAKLYFSHKNPNPNYQQALRELEMYLSSDPVGGGADEIQDWLAVLRELEKTSEESKKSKQKMSQLLKDNKELKDAIVKLKDSVEKLNDLDIRMEEKRKQVK